MNRRIAALTVLGLLFTALVAWAGVKWPNWSGVAPKAMAIPTVSAHMAYAVMQWAFALGIVVEYPFVRLFFRIGVLKAVRADVLMNLAPPVLIFLLCMALAAGDLVFLFSPLLNVTAVIFPGSLANMLLHCGTFNPIIWTMMCVYAVTFNAGLQCLVLRYGMNVKVDNNGFWGLLAANLAALTIASISLLLKNSSLL